jgi:hypothetical protein
MDLSTAANVVNAVAVLAGVIFAATQIRDYRQKRRRDSMLNLVQSFQNPTFVRGLRTVIELPENVTAEELRRRLGPEGEDLVAHLTATWETLGVMLFHNEITLEIVDDFFSGPILITWRKLEPYLNYLRAHYARDTWFEWFQWMRDRMAEREAKTPPVPAYRAHGAGTDSFDRWLKADQRR